MDLEIQAEYNQEADRLDVLVWLFDQVEQVAHPELIREGTATLWHAGYPTGVSWTFDMTHGNGKDSSGVRTGSVYLSWSRPEVVHNTEVRVSITQTDDAVVESTAAVVPVDRENFIPLARQEDQDEILYKRDQERIDQNL